MTVINFLRAFYTKLISAGEVFQDFLLLAIRLYWGYYFFTAGIGKLDNIEQTAGFFEQLSVPLPLLSAYLAATTEMIGGACLVVGFATRLVAIPLAFTMVMAYISAHFDVVKNLLSNPEAFVSASPFGFLLASLIVFAFGPGKFSLDYVIEMLVYSKK